jgi:hypothetical protein
MLGLEACVPLSAEPNMLSDLDRVSTHCVGQRKPLAAFGNFSWTLAASQCVIAIIGTLTFISSIWRAAVAAPFEWPEMIRTSGFKAFDLGQRGRHVGQVSRQLVVR